MESKRSASIALFFSLNILFFAMVTESACVCSPSPSPSPSHSPSPSPSPTPKPIPSPIPNPIPSPIPIPNPTPNSGTCPINALKLGVCANVLNLVNVTIGSPAATQCCPLINGLVNLDAAVCICTAIRANVLGIITVNVPLAISLILGACGKQTPPGFQCR